MEALQLEEAKIDPAFLRENQPFQENWYSTVKAVHIIQTERLIPKGGYKGVDDYLTRRWNGCCRRTCFYTSGWAGRVITQLEECGIAKEHLPSNTRLCIALKQIAATYNISLVDAWYTLLEKFGSRDNVDQQEPTPPEEETTTVSDVTIEQRLRKRRKVNYAQEEERDEDEDEEMDEEEEQEYEEEEEEEPVRKRDKIREVEWNTPDYLANLINKFAGTFEGSF
ncbi:hypothetical protein HK097_002835 [Rhizophlyctis rosea]|uniref:Uncharacterized protein n=1 Tax=Rhizophlyctis rosea TaxID=64517 RepID=A0AAD5S363_9FUNG|nr:hypothetical protein HK097_002835 [Rhizophlyctis rosea]